MLMYASVPCLVFHQTAALFDTICKGCVIQCKGCSIEGREPVCLEKLDHSSAAGGTATIESLSIETGYWRATNTSLDILACYNSEACVGGLTGKKDYCRLGYEGPYKNGEPSSASRLKKPPDII